VRVERTGLSGILSCKFSLCKLAINGHVMDMCLNIVENMRECSSMSIHPCNFTDKLAAL